MGAELGLAEQLLRGVAHGLELYVSRVAAYDGEGHERVEVER